MKLYFAIFVFPLLFLSGCGSDTKNTTDITPADITPTNITPTLQLSASATSVEAGEPITLTAQANDIDGSITSYRWQQTLGTVVELTKDATTTLTIIAPSVSVEEDLTITLTVNDNNGASIEKSVSILIKEKDKAPSVVIESSYEAISEGVKVTLSAKATDEDVTSLTYLWQQREGPQVVISDLNSSIINFIVPSIQNDSKVSLSLQVTDIIGQTNNTHITLKSLIPPEIYAPYESINLMSLEQIDLSVSAIDLDGEIISYRWQQISGPALTFEDVGAATLSVTAPELNIDQLAIFEVAAVDDDNLFSKTILSINLFPRYQMTTMKGRTDGKGVDLVILADGFSKDELPQFEQATNDFIKDFIQEDTIKVHQNAWNIHRIDSISQQSGADFPEDDVYVETVFDSYFQCGNIARLLCINSSKVLAVTARIAPQFDQVLVIVNSPTYGGGGGQVATFSLAQSATDVAIHELGHSFAGLADEYDYGATNDTVYEPYEPYEPNVTTITNPTEVKWRHWFEDINNIPTKSGQAGVGLFEGARYHAKNYYRPLDNSIMKVLAEPFGPVNAEAWALNVYGTAGSLLSIEPTEESINHVVDTPLVFKINPIHAPENSKITWWVNDIERDSDVSKPTQLTLNTPPSANYSVKVEIVDNSGLIKKDTEQLAMDSFTWSVTTQ